MSGLFSVVFLQILFKYGGTAFEVHSCGRAIYEPFLFSEDVKNPKFLGEADDSLNVCCRGGFFHSMVTRVHIPRQLPLKQKRG